MTTFRAISGVAFLMMAFVGFMEFNFGHGGPGALMSCMTGLIGLALTDIAVAVAGWGRQ